MLSRAGSLRELVKSELLEMIATRDLLVVNNTKVIPARVFSENNLEILFIRELESSLWQVLFPAREHKIGAKFALPEGLELTLMEKGLPQVVGLSRPIDSEYFEKHGELALPPYIQEARGERHNVKEDALWYQTAWAKHFGSTAAPTASLHFTEEDLAHLRARDVAVAELTLHVGPGTFLPVRTEDLSSHVMHEEAVHIPASTLREWEACKSRGGRVWALGTTVTRALESWQNGLLDTNSEGASGFSRLFIYPPYQYKAVDVLLTNFHQPRSTLLALVAAFAGLEPVKRAYAWAMERKFRLFSYGDLSVWMK